MMMRRPFPINNPLGLDLSFKTIRGGRLALPVINTK